MNTGDSRIPLCAGSTIKVGDTTYIVEEMISSGGQALLYVCRNSNGSKFCLKEFYPIGAKRSANGSVVPLHGWNTLRNGLHISRELVKDLRTVSHQGILLPFQWDNDRMVEVMNLAPPGNCCTLSDLSSKLDSERVPSEVRLRKAAEVIQSLLRVLQLLHEKLGLIHSDIKTENVIWADDKEGRGGVAFPIDFSACCQIGCDHSLPSFSPGFSHPFQDESTIQRDIYSVSATFLSLVGGQKLMDECLDGVLPDLTFQPTLHRLVSELDLSADIRWKFFEILKRATTLEEALHYTSAGEFGREVGILLEIIDNKGLHRETLLKNSRLFYNRSFEEVYGNTFDEDLCPEIDGEIDGKKTQLCSEGGAGKTTTFFSLWKQYLDRCENSPHCPVPIYIQLNGFDPEKSDWENYILDAILLSYSTVPKTEEYRTRLLHLLQTANCLLLLDGIGEGVHNDKLKKELEGFVKIKNLSLCISTRSPLGDTWGELTKYLSTISLMPLSPNTVLDKIREKGFALPSSRLLEVLRRPMFLAIFLKLKDVKKNVETTGELLEEHHRHLIQSYQNSFHGSDREDVQKLVMDEILPEFAYRMNKIRFETNAARECLEEIIKEHEAEPQYGDAIVFQLKDGKPLGKVSIQLLVDAGIIRRAGPEELVFCHQNYLHFYIARYVHRKIVGEKIFPEKPMSNYVRSYLGDLLGEYAFVENEIAPDIKTSPIEKLLQDVQEESDPVKRQAVTKELIEVMKTSRQNRLAVNFDEIDLSGADFTACDLAGASFKNAIIPDDMLLPTVGHSRPIWGLLTVPKSSLIITVDRDYARLYIWNHETSDLIRIIKLAFRPDMWAVSPDGRYIAVRNVRSFSIYRVKSGEIVTTWTVNPQNVVKPNIIQQMERLDFTYAIMEESVKLLSFVNDKTLICNCGPYLCRIAWKRRNGNVKPYFLESAYKNQICDFKVMPKSKKLILLSRTSDVIILSRTSGLVQHCFSLPDKRADYCQLEVSNSEQIVRVGWRYGLKSSFCHLSEDGLWPYGEHNGLARIIDNYVVCHNEEELIWQFDKFDKEEAVAVQCSRSTFSCISQDGRKLLVSTVSGKIHIYDIQSGRLMKIMSVEMNKNVSILNFAAVDDGGCVYKRSDGPIMLIKPNAEKHLLCEGIQPIPFCYRGFDGNFFFQETLDQHLETFSLLSGEIMERVDISSIRSKKLCLEDIEFRTAIYNVKYIPKFRKLVAVSLNGDVRICDCETAHWHWLWFSSKPQLPPIRFNVGRGFDRIAVCGDNLLCVDRRGVLSQWDLDGNCLRQFGESLPIKDLIPRPEGDSCIIRMESSENRLQTRIWDITKMDFISDEAVDPVGFDGLGRFRIRDKYTGKLLREIGIDTTKNTMMDFKLSDTGDTFVVLMEDQTLLVYGIYDHSLDKVIPTLIPTRIANCDFRGANMTENLREKIKHSEETVIF